jgi:hypothetical protein
MGRVVSSLSPSVYIEKLENGWMDHNDIWYWIILRNIVQFVYHLDLTCSTTSLKTSLKTYMRFCAYLSKYLLKSNKYRTNVANNNYTFYYSMHFLCKAYGFWKIKQYWYYENISELAHSITYNGLLKETAVVKIKRKIFLLSLDYITVRFCSFNVLLYYNRILSIN